MEMFHVQLLQGLKHKINYFYFTWIIYSYSWELSIGFLWMYKTTHIIDFSGTLSCEHACDLQKTHSCTKRQKHTHKMISYGMMWGWIYFLDAGVRTQRNSFLNLLYLWPIGQISHAHTQTPLKVKKPHLHEFDV